MDKKVLSGFLKISPDELELQGVERSNSANISGSIFTQRSCNKRYFIKSIERFKLLKQRKTVEEKNLLLNHIFDNSFTNIVTPIRGADGDFILKNSEQYFLVFPYIEGKSPRHRLDFAPTDLIRAIAQMANELNTKMNTNNMLTPFIDQDRYQLDVINKNFIETNSKINNLNTIDINQYSDIIANLIDTELNIGDFSALCHGDSNLSNIILTSNGVKFIDLDCMTFSTPFLDIFFYLVVNGRTADEFDYAIEQMNRYGFVLSRQDLTIFFYYIFGWIGYVASNVKENSKDDIFLRDLVGHLSLGLDKFFRLTAEEFL